MSDTTEQECACCGFDTDCIQGLCSSCYDYNCEIEKLNKQLIKSIRNKPITEHPDVQRLIIQVETLSQENKRLSKRDCNSTVQILLPTADRPFNKEDCRIVDVGYSDNIYVVECAAVTELQAENAKLKEALKVARGMIMMGYDRKDDARGYEQIEEALKGE